MAQILLGQKTEPTYVPLFDTDGQVLIDGQFLITPVTNEDDREWRKEFHFCPKCGGMGFLPLGKHAPPCPMCHCSPTAPSLDTREIQLVLAGRLCLGWKEVPLAGGGEQEFNAAALESLVSRFPQSFWAMLRAARALGSGQTETEAKN
jgi:hypothetical protein